MKRRKIQDHDNSLKPGMIDSHFHLLMLRNKGLDPKTVLVKALKTGLAGGIDIGTTLGDSSERISIIREIYQEINRNIDRGVERDADRNPDMAITTKTPGILFSAGLSPGEAERRSPDDSCRLLEQEIDTIKKQYTACPAGIGEIGLDFHWNYATPELQAELFKGQLRLANRYNLPVLIHNRKAGPQTIKILNEIPPQAGGIMHCFSDTWDIARQAVDLGLLISFAGSITYPNSNDLRETARRLPVDAVLAETDSPFLAAQPIRGKINHPGHVGYTYEALARIRNRPLPEIIEQLAANYYRLFMDS